jgi:thioredoxin-related protein
MEANAHVKEMPMHGGRWGALGVWLAMGLLLMGCVSSPKEAPEKPKYLVLMELTASDCAPCQEMHRIVQNLKDRYSDRITFVTLDITNSHNKRFAAETAGRFHGEALVRRYQERPGTVVLLDARDGEAVGLLQEDTDSARYTALIETALEQASSH